MKTVLTENWIPDEAKYLFSTEKFLFVEKPKLFQFLLEGQIARCSRPLAHPLLPMPWISRGCAGSRGAETAARAFGAGARSPVTPVEVPLQGTTVTTFML